MSSSAPPRPTGSVHPIRKQLDELDALINRMLTVPVDGAEEGTTTLVAEPLPLPSILKVPDDPAPSVREARHDRSEPANEEPVLTPAVDRLSGTGSLPRVSQPTIGHAERTIIFPPPEPAPSRIIEGKKAPAAMSLGPAFSPLFNSQERESIPQTTLPEHLTARIEEPINPPSREIERPNDPSAAFQASKAAPNPPLLPSGENGAEKTPWLLWPLIWFNLAFDGGTFLLGPLGQGLRTHRGRGLLGWTGLALLAAAAVWVVLDWIGWPW